MPKWIPINNNTHTPGWK